MQPGQLFKFVIYALQSSAASQAGHEYYGEKHTCDKATNVVENADTGCGKAPDQVQAKPEDPLSDRSRSVGSKRAPIGDVEDAQCPEHAKDGTGCSCCQFAGLQEESNDASENARAQIDDEVTPFPVKKFDNSTDQEEREHVQSYVYEIEMDEHGGEDAPILARLLNQLRILCSKLDQCIQRKAVNTFTHYGHYQVDDYVDGDKYVCYQAGTLA